MLAVAHYKMEDINQLKALWTSLAPKANETVFQSWAWIDAWLHTMLPKVIVLECKLAEQTVGICLLTQCTPKRYGLNINTLYLQQTGLHYQDQIWVEYNQPLVDQRYQKEVIAAISHYVMAVLHTWDEWVLSGIMVSDRLFYTDTSHFYIHQQWITPCFGVDLAALKTAGKPYIDTLSANTRYQLRRAEKKLVKRGHTGIARPGSVAEAITWFDEIGPLHIKRWGHSAEGSGFSNPDFVAFHHYVIAQYWQAGLVDIAALTVDNNRIAFFYNFSFKGVIYFYLGAVVFETDNQIKPGLLGHAMLIQHYLEQGAVFYDFMGGDALYKRRLGQVHNYIESITLKRKTLFTFFEQSARKCKHFFSRVTKDG